jgi:hypothetical protein
MNRRPGLNCHLSSSDQLKYKVQLNAYVNTIALPNSQDWVRPWQVCSVTVGGKLTSSNYSDTFQEVELEFRMSRSAETSSQTTTSSSCVEGTLRTRKLLLVQERGDFKYLPMDRVMLRTDSPGVFHPTATTSLDLSMRKISIFLGWG